MAVKALAKAPAVRKGLTFAKNVGLFLAAPFVGLAYVMLFPFIGIGIVVTMGCKALAKAPAARKALTFAKNAGLFLAALHRPRLHRAVPFIGMVDAGRDRCQGAGQQARGSLTKRRQPRSARHKPRRLKADTIRGGELP
ncbi:MAG: hypothetical protein IPI73_18755 [Betaproteobacteria bacterium]|nr:hypothetical protein [Betaproteobacteria bacterium]